MNVSRFLRTTFFNLEMLKIHYLEKGEPYLETLRDNVSLVSLIHFQFKLWDNRQNLTRIDPRKGIPV